MEYINLDKEKLNRLIEHYEEAKSSSAEVVVFEGNILGINYAKYLIEFAKDKLLCDNDDVYKQLVNMLCIVKDCLPELYMLIEKNTMYPDSDSDTYTDKAELRALANIIGEII